MRGDASSRSRSVGPFPADSKIATSGHLALEHVWRAQGKTSHHFLTCCQHSVYSLSGLTLPWAEAGLKVNKQDVGNKSGECPLSSMLNQMPEVKPRVSRKIADLDRLLYALPVKGPASYQVPTRPSW